MQNPSQDVPYGRLFCVRMLVFYIKSHVKCPFCEIFTNSDSYKVLKVFDQYLDPSLEFYYDDRPSDWHGFDIKRYTDKEVKEAKDRGETLKSWTPDPELRNYLFSMAYTTKFPSIILELFYGGGSIRTIPVRGIFTKENEAELSLTFLNFLRSFFSKRISPQMQKRMSKEFKHEKAEIPGSAKLMHKLKKEEGQIIQNKYEELNIKKLEKLIKIQENKISSGELKEPQELQEFAMLKRAYNSKLNLQSLKEKEKNQKDEQNKYKKLGIEEIENLIRIQEEDFISGKLKKQKQIEEFRMLKQAYYSKKNNQSIAKEEIKTTS